MGEKEIDMKKEAMKVEVEAAANNTTIANDNAPVNAPDAAPAPAQEKPAFKFTAETLAQYRANKKIADSYQAMRTALDKGDYRRAGEAALAGGVFVGLAANEFYRSQAWATAKDAQEAFDANRTDEGAAWVSADAHQNAEAAEKKAKTDAAQTGTHIAFINRYAKLLGNCTTEEAKAKVKAEMAAELKKLNK